MDGSYGNLRESSGFPGAHFFWLALHRFLLPFSGWMAAILAILG